jgi:hypothetical protein
LKLNEEFPRRFAETRMRYADGAPSAAVMAKGKPPAASDLAAKSPG